MNKCMREGCTELKRAKSLFCSDACNKAWRRANPDRTAGLDPDNVQVDTEPGQPYQLIPYTKVYGRPAVRYEKLREPWGLRPEPLSSDDKPKPGNRGKYIRPDKTEYQFDAIGQVFECTFVDGKSLVYPTMADLRQAQQDRTQTPQIDAGATNAPDMTQSKGQAGTGPNQGHRA